MQYPSDVTKGQKNRIWKDFSTAGYYNFHKGSSLMFAVYPFPDHIPTKHKRAQKTVWVQKK